jgi:hypothetical protein
VLPNPLTVEHNRSFYTITGTCRLHLQGRRITQARNQFFLLPVPCWFLAWFIYRSWWWRRVPPKRQFNFNGLHSIVSQKIQLFSYKIAFLLLLTQQCLKYLFKSSNTNWKSDNSASPCRFCSQTSFSNVYCDFLDSFTLTFIRYKQATTSAEKHSF